MKKILLISPNYFEYNGIILQNLKNMNYDVYWFDDRPTTNIFLKSLLRIFPFIFKSKIKKYFYKNILEKTRLDKFDFVFVILGQSFSKQMMDDLKKTHPESKFLYYLWDSIENFPQCLAISTIFDKTFSFDKYDCSKYNFIFLPLFYSVNLGNCEKKYKFDLSYVGTIKKGKIYTYLRLKKYCEKNNINFYGYAYLQSRLVYLFYRIFDVDFRKLKPKMNDFKYSKLSYSEYLSTLLSSRSTLDIQMKNQSGLPMRIFECLGTKTKVISFNNEIKDYNFYNPTNFLVLDLDNSSLNLPKSFLFSSYAELDKNIINQYSIESRLKKIGF